MGGRRNREDYLLDLAQLMQIQLNRPRAHLFLINRARTYGKVPSADTTS